MLPNIGIDDNVAVSEQYVALLKYSLLGWASLDDLARVVLVKRDAARQGVCSLFEIQISSDLQCRNACF